MSEQTPNLNRYYKAVSRLSKDLDRSIYMDMYEGLGEVALNTYTGIHAAVKSAIDDPYLTSVAPPDESKAAKMEDKQIVALVHLLSGQLIVYLEDVLGKNEDS